MKRFDWPKEANEKMKHFGTRAQAFSLNEHEKKFIRRNWEDEYLLIDTKRHKDKRMGWCTHCRRWEKISKGADLSHLSKVYCPSCGNSLQVIHTWRRTGRLYSVGIFYLYRQSAIDPETVTCRLVWIGRSWRMAGSPPETSEKVLTDSFYVFSPKKKGWQLKTEGNGQILNKIIWRASTKEDVYAVARKVGPRDYVYPQCLYGHQVKNITIAEDKEGAFDAARDSPLRYGMEEWGGWQDDHYIVFWSYAARYPAVEWLLKMGFVDALSEQLKWRSGNIGESRFKLEKGAFYLRGKTLDKVMHGFHLTKEDKRWALNEGVDEEDLRTWQALKGEVPLREVCAFCACSGYVNIGEMLEMLDRFSIRPLRFIRYVIRQRELERKKPERNRHGRISTHDYLDYIENAEKLRWDTSSKQTLFPSDFWKAHDDAADMVAQIKHKADAQKFKQRSRQMKLLYTFEDNNLGMKIVVPTSPLDYIREGKQNRNCVGGYVESVTNGKTDVVFVRRIEDLSKSYITMEIHDGQIKQARTFANGPLDDEGKAFVELFRKKKLEKKSKSRRKTA